jgi:cell wall-associated NlpC family hydrolase
VTPGHPFAEHREPAGPNRRRRGRGDRGAIQAPVAIAVGAAALLLVPLLFGAALLGTDNDTNGGCGVPAAAQPDLASAAQTGIPATYLRLYQQAGQRYGLAWNVLAAIGKIESDHGRDTSPGSGVRTGANYAGAAGPMQIGIGGQAGNNWGGAPRHPANQKTGGVGIDGDDDGWADVHDPADAIPAAARYLLAHGAPGNLQHAVFAYNPSTTYVDNVLTQASRYAAGGFQPITDIGAVLGTCPGDADAYAGISGGVATKVIAYAKAQLGKPYVYGGQGPDTFDCSGLTMMAYRAAHITIPRTSDTQYWYGKRISAGTEQPGDLVFFDFKPGHSGPGHVGIVNNPQTGIMIVAPHTGDVVKYQSYKAYPGGPVGFTRPTARVAVGSQIR